MRPWERVVRSTYISGVNKLPLVDPNGLEPIYDTWHNYLYRGLRQGQAIVNDAWATNGFGVAAATALNTVGELGVGIADLPAGIAHLPEAWAHVPEEIAAFARHPGPATTPGLGNACLTVSGTFFFLRGGARWAGKLGEALEARSPGFFRCRRGSIRFGTTEHFDLRTAEGRRTGQVVNDIQNARPKDVAIDTDTGNYVVRGPKGREHIVSPEGRGVTGIDRSHAAHLGRLRSGRIRG